MISFTPQTGLGSDLEAPQDSDASPLHTRDVQELGPGPTQAGKLGPGLGLSSRAKLFAKSAFTHLHSSKVCCSFSGCFVLKEADVLSVNSPRNFYSFDVK